MKRAQRIALSVLMVATLFSSGCLFGSSFSVFFSDGIVSISYGGVFWDACTENESQEYDCAFFSNTGITARTLSLPQLLVRLILIDPLIIQLPDDATDFAGSFLHSESSTGGALTITAGLASVPMDVNRTLVADPGTQLVVIGMPNGAPTAGTFAFNLNFRVPPGTTAIAAKPIITGLVELTDGSIFYPPLFPCADDLAIAPTLTIPLPAPGDTFTLPPASPDLACDITYDFIPALPPVDFDLDHFMLYGAKTTTKTPKFVKLGPVQLADRSYAVVKPQALGVPANKNQEGVRDAETHLTEYRVKLAPGFTSAKQQGVRIVNQCNDLFLEVGKPRSLLVPSALCVDEPPGTCAAPLPPPDAATHHVDHFLCHQAKPERKLADGSKLPKFPKGLQVEVADAFQTRRYDLKKITKLCDPVAKSGAPVLLAGPDKGSSYPLTPAAVEQPDAHLVCYQAKLARKTIAQNGCGAVPGNQGTTIDPKQAKHQKRTGLVVASQLGERRLDTTKEIELCLPSQRVALTPASRQPITPTVLKGDPTSMDEEPRGGGGRRSRRSWPKLGAEGVGSSRTPLAPSARLGMMDAGAPAFRDPHGDHLERLRAPRCSPT